MKHHRYLFSSRFVRVTAKRIALAAMAVVAWNAAASDGASHGSLTVFKDPNCGCCSDWVDHVHDHGIEALARNHGDMAGLKTRLGIGPALRSCHTAVTEAGYVFEGHVPARYIEAFLDNPPAGAVGLSVPAMPVGSPGMEMGDRFMAYDVVQLNQDGSTQVFAAVASPADQ